MSFWPSLRRSLAVQEVVNALAAHPSLPSNLADRDSGPLSPATVAPKGVRSLAPSLAGPLAPLRGSPDALDGFCLIHGVRVLDNVRSVKYLYNMAPANRHKPQRAASSESDYSITEFMGEFPDDAACLEHLWRSRYSEDGEHAECPKCEQDRRFKRYATSRGASPGCCTGCGHHVHPTAGTIFHKSSTSLHLWFYAMYLMTSTRCGISAKQLERELGVSYKTAWRMMNKIRNKLMNDDEGEQLTGDVEIDETSWGGRPRNKLPDKKAVARFREAKPTILGMVERGGRVRLRVIPSRRGPALSREVRANVNPACDHLHGRLAGVQAAQGRVPRPPDHQPLGGRLRPGRRAYELDRGPVREPQDRDARCLQEGFAASGFSRIWTNTPGATTSATGLGRCSRRSRSELRQESLQMERSSRHERHGVLSRC